MKAHIKPVDLPLEEIYDENVLRLALLSPTDAHCKMMLCIP